MTKVNAASKSSSSSSSSSKSSGSSSSKSSGAAVDAKVKAASAETNKTSQSTKTQNTTTQNTNAQNINNQKATNIANRKPAETKTDQVKTDQAIAAPKSDAAAQAGHAAGLEAQKSISQSLLDGTYQGQKTPVTTAQQVQDHAKEQAERLMQVDAKAQTEAQQQKNHQSAQEQIDGLKAASDQAAHKAEFSKSLKDAAPFKDIGTALQNGQTGSAFSSQSNSDFVKKLQADDKNKIKSMSDSLAPNGRSTLPGLPQSQFAMGQHKDNNNVLNFDQKKAAFTQGLEQKVLAQNTVLQNDSAKETAATENKTTATKQIQENQAGKVEAKGVEEKKNTQAENAKSKEAEQSNSEQKQKQTSDIARIKNWSEKNIASYDDNNNKNIASGGAQKAYDALTGKSELGQLTKNESKELLNTLSKAWSSGPKDRLSSENSNIHQNIREFSRLVEKNPELRDMTVDAFATEATSSFNQQAKLKNEKADNTGVSNLALEALNLNANRALEHLKGAEKGLAKSVAEQGKDTELFKTLSKAKPGIVNDTLTTELFIARGNLSPGAHSGHADEMSNALVHNWTNGKKDASAYETKKRLEGILKTHGGQQLLMNKNVAPEQRSAALAKIMSDPQMTADKVRDGWASKDVVKTFGANYFKNFAQARGTTDPQTLKGSDLSNSVGVALSMKPDEKSGVTEADLNDPQKLAALSKNDFYKNNEDVQKVVKSIQDVGGQDAKVTVLPVLHSSNNYGMIQVPLFRVEGKDPNSPKFVDNIGRVYQNRQDWEKNNALPNRGRITVPENMDLKNLNPKEPFHAQTSGEVVKEGLDAAALTGGVIAGAGLVFTSGGTAAPALLPVAGASGLWTTGSSAYDLKDMYDHGQSINLSNPEARGKWFDVVGGGLNMASMKTAILASRLKAGDTAAKAVAGLNIAASSVDVAAFADSGQQLARSWGNMNGEQKVTSLLKMGFWAGMTGANVRATGAQARDVFNFPRLQNYIKDKAAVPVVANDKIAGDGLHVAYDRDKDGKLSNVRIEHNPNHKPSEQDLKLHSDVARLVEGTGGLRERIGQYFKGEAPLEPGSVGWEARHEIGKLGGKIDHLTASLSKGNLSPSERTRIEGEIASLKGDVDRYRTLLNQADRNGRGFIAADSSATALAKERGYPTGDELPPHHYWNQRPRIDPKTGESVIDPKTDKEVIDLFLQRTDASKTDLYKYNEATKEFDRIPGTKSIIDPLAELRGVQPKSREEALSRLEESRRRIERDGYHHKYTDSELQAMAKAGDIGNERFQVRFMEERFLQADGSTDPLSGKMGAPFKGKSAEGVKYWSTSFDQIEDADTDPKLISEKLGLSYDPGKKYVLVIVDNEKAAALSGTHSIVPTFDNLGNFAKAELPTGSVTNKTVDKVMTPDYQKEYARLYDEAQKQGIDISKAEGKKDFEAFLTKQGYDVDTFEGRLLLHEKLGNNEHFTGNGLTKSLIARLKQKYGTVETFNFEHTPQTLQILQDNGAITIIPSHKLKEIGK